MTFSIQDATGLLWRRVVDTGDDAPADFIEACDDMPAVSDAYEVKGGSIAALIRPCR